jgi:pimeloyl-ACP methyl ester carboxylesterase
MFIHGWLGSWRYWLPTMDALSEEYRVYALDLWGFGDSDKSKHEYSVDGYVRLLHAFVQELGIFGTIPLVGHALGAVVAVLFAEEHPDIVDRVMAVSLPLHGEAVMSACPCKGRPSIGVSYQGEGRSWTGFWDVRPRLGMKISNKRCNELRPVQSTRASLL